MHLSNYSSTTYYSSSATVFAKEKQSASVLQHKVFVVNCFDVCL